MYIEFPLYDVNSSNTDTTANEYIIISYEKLLSWR